MTALTSSDGIDGFVADVGPRLVRMLTVHVGSRSVAEELAQETLVRCIERWDVVSRVERRDAWAYRVAFNLANSRWRRLWRQRSLDHRHDRAEPGPDREELVILRDELDQLPDRQRAAVVCRHLLGLDVRTTAEVLDCAEGTVKALTAQGLGRLRDRLVPPTEGGER